MKQLNYITLSVAIIFFIFTPVIYAGDGFNEVKPKHWYLDFGLGTTFKQRVRDSYVPRAPGDPIDRYKVNSVQNNSIALVSLGYVWTHSKAWLPYVSTGLEYSYLPSAKISGKIEEFSRPNRSNYNYEYQLAHRSLTINSKFDLWRWGNWMPYISLGLGSAWNKSSEYNETALTPQVRIPATFSNLTKTQFTYNTGLGLDFIFNKNIWLSLAYRYDNFFNNATGQGTRKFSKKQINSRSHANSVLLTVRYLFA